MRSERERIDAEERARHSGDDIDGIDGIDGIPKSIFDTAPEFPLEALPPVVERLVREGAKAIGCPPDLIALPALATCATAIGNARVIRPKRGWTEGAALYAAVVADSGEKKTAAIGAAVEPLERVQRRMNREHEKALDEHARMLREWKRDCADARKDRVPEPPEPPPPVAGKVHVNDTTVEALVPILRDNPRGVLQERDEVAGWINSFDQYRSGRGADRQFWLSVWSNRSASVDRKGHEGRPLAVPRPFVSVVGGIQPDVLPELAGGREDGMLERFLIAYPQPLNARYSTSEISDAAHSGYGDLIDRLRSLRLGVDEFGDPLPQAVTFAPDALEVWIDAYNEHRDQMGAPWLQPGLRAAWSKLEAYLLRLTLICACCRFVSGERRPAERVETDDVVRAVVLLDYFKEHARSVHAVLRGEDKKLLLLEDLSAFLRRHGAKWEGEMHQLREKLAAREAPRVKPPPPNVLSRRINEFAADPRTRIKVEDGTRFDAEKGQGRRVVKITLRNIVDMVDIVDGEERG